MIRELSKGLQEIHELPDGFALRFPGDDLWARKLIEFITFERECCPFLSFELEFAADGGPIWMSVAGPGGAKEFIRAEVGSAGVSSTGLMHGPPAEGLS